MIRRRIPEGSQWIEALLFAGSTNLQWEENVRRYSKLGKTNTLSNGKKERVEERCCIGGSGGKRPEHGIERTDL